MVNDYAGPKCVTLFLIVSSKYSRRSFICTDTELTSTLLLQISSQNIPPLRTQHLKEQHRQLDSVHVRTAITRSASL